MENRVTLGTYEIPTVLGSFDAQDVLGTAEGVICGGSTVCL